MRSIFITIILFSASVFGFSQSDKSFSHNILFRPEFWTTRTMGPGVNADLFYTFTFFEHFRAHAAISMDVGRFQLSAYRFGFSGSMDVWIFGLMAGISFLDQALPQYGRAYHVIIPQIEIGFLGFRIHGGLAQSYAVLNTNSLYNVFDYNTPYQVLSFEVSIAYRLELFDKKYSIEGGWNTYEPLRFVYYTAFGFYADQRYRLDDTFAFELYTGIRMTGSLDLTAQINELSIRAGVEVTL